MMKKQILVFLISLISCHYGWGHELDLAFDRMNNFDSRQWSFKVISSGEDEKIVLHDPQNNPRWILASVNGRPPSSKEVKKFLKEKKDEESESNGKLDLNKMVVEGSLKKVSENDEQAIYTFKPILDDGSSIADSFQGKLWLDKSENFIRRFEFYNIEDFSPALSVEVKNMKTVMNFHKIAENIYAPDNLSMKLLGKMMVFKTLEQEESQQFKDYRFVAKEAASNSPASADLVK